MIVMKPSEIIDKALTEVIPTADAWCQGALVLTTSVEGGERHCMAGAMQKVAGVLNTVYHDSPEYKAYLRARLICLNTIWDQGHGTGTTVPRFNDSNDYNAVREIMEKARARAQEKGE